MGQRGGERGGGGVWSIDFVLSTHHYSCQKYGPWWQFEHRLLIPWVTAPGWCLHQLTLTSLGLVHTHPFTTFGENESIALQTLGQESSSTDSDISGLVHTLSHPFTVFDADRIADIGQKSSSTTNSDISGLFTRIFSVLLVSKLWKIIHWFAHRCRLTLTNLLDWNI